MYCLMICIVSNVQSYIFVRLPKSQYSHKKNEYEMLSHVYALISVVVVVFFHSCFVVMIWSKLKIACMWNTNNVGTVITLFGCWVWATKDLLKWTTETMTTFFGRIMFCEKINIFFFKTMKYDDGWFEASANISENVRNTFICSVSN